MDMMRWINDWNTILRNVIFADSDLKKLMEVPDNTNIITFIDKYFVKAGYTNKLLKDEAVRIVYADIPGYETKVPNVMVNVMTFDIYVKLEELHNFGVDRLMMRTELIANRLLKLLTTNNFIHNTGYKFRIAKAWDRGTSTIGYARYTIAFYYNKVF